MLENGKRFCDSCAVSGDRVLATGHSTNPDWSGYDLCDECQEEYNQRDPIVSEWPDLAMV
jgi:hypothetical protein